MSAAAVTPDSKKSPIGETIPLDDDCDLIIFNSPVPTAELGLASGSGETSAIGIVGGSYKCGLCGEHFHRHQVQNKGSTKYPTWRCHPDVAAVKCLEDAAANSTVLKKQLSDLKKNKTLFALKIQEQRVKGVESGMKRSTASSLLENMVADTPCVAAS
jgi:uncharacterized protein YihD (DUF1040 family)